MSQDRSDGEGFPEEQRALVVFRGMEDTIYLAMLHEMKKSAAALSPSQVDEIADRVATRLEAKFGDDGPRHSSIRQGVRDIIIGVLSSGVWEFLVYLATHVRHFDGPTGHKGRDKRLLRAEWELTKTMNDELRKDLYSSAELIDQAVGTPTIKGLGERIMRSAFLTEFVEARLKRLGYSREDHRDRVANSWAEDIRELLLDQLTNESISNLAAER